QAEDGIRDGHVTGVQTCALPICRLGETGDLQVRTFVFRGARHWRAMPSVSPASGLVRLGPVKFLLDERTSDPNELRAGVTEAHRSEERRVGKEGGARGGEHGSDR